MVKKKKKNKRLGFLNIIPRDVKKILDVGCGDGYLSSKLRERGMEVVGIDRDDNVCSKARGRLDKVIIADIEELKLPYPQGYFDCIIYADILDCLIDPLSTLKKHKYYLRDGGYIIASMANIRYYKVIIRLFFGGTWDYIKEGGILWWHHLRFFTLVNMKELFVGAGFQILDVRRYIFASRGFKILNFMFLNKLKDFLTYQYYIKARKTTVSSESSSVKKRTIHRF